MATIVFDQVSKLYAGGVRAVDRLDLSIDDGELLVLVGPSGCGKSTAMRMVAGLEEISEGEIRIGARVVNDLPPQRRNVAMVFQNYALYPHMTVRRNLEFPLRMQKLPRDEIERRVTETAAMLNLQELLERRPKALSGGQRQRVAMGRAIIRDADVFLMDEPLSNLDAKLRVQIRGEIAALQARLGITTIYVTHDQVEAMTLGQRVAVLRDGRLQQVATPLELYRNPANIFVAGFVGSPGMNIVRAKLEATQDGVVLSLGKITLTLSDRLADRYPGLSSRLGEDLLVGVRPSAIQPAESDAVGTLSARVRVAEFLGHETLLQLDADVTTVVSDGGSPPPLVAVLPGHHPLRPGERLQLAIDAAELSFFSPDGVVLLG